MAFKGLSPLMSRRETSAGRSGDMAILRADRRLFSMRDNVDQAH
jgi:hypothetical protein